MERERGEREERERGDEEGEMKKGRRGGGERGRRRARRRGDRGGGTCTRHIYTFYFKSPLHIMTCLVMHVHEQFKVLIIT